MRCPVSFNWKINSEPNLSHTQPSCSSLMPSRSHAYISTTFHFPSTLAALISRTPWFNTFTDKVLSRRLNNCTPNPWYLKLLSQVFLLHCLIRHILLHVKSLHVTQGDSLSFLTSKKKNARHCPQKESLCIFTALNQCAFHGNEKTKPSIFSQVTLCSAGLYYWTGVMRR